jgi:hypothetical protein
MSLPRTALKSSKLKTTAHGTQARTTIYGVGNQIPVLAQDRHQTVAELNWVMVPSNRS